MHPRVERIKEEALRIAKHPRTLPIAVGVVSFASGLGAGYILGKRNNTIVVDDFPHQLEFDFDASKLAEVSYWSEAHTSSNGSGSVVVYLEDNDEEQGPEEPQGAEDPSGPKGPGDPDAIVLMDVLQEEVDLGSDSRAAAAAFVQERIQQAIQEHQGPDEEPAPEEVVTNIFSRGNNDDWDYEAELKKRNTNEPYIIHRDEFYNDEQGYTQLTLTYYAGDDIMVDEEDAPIYNYQQVTGPLRFGHGSEDPNVFHVRNDKRRAEYEIIRDDGLFSVEVLGLEIENNVRARDLKHSNTPRFKLE